MVQIIGHPPCMACSTSKHGIPEDSHKANRFLSTVFFPPFQRGIDLSKILQSLTPRFLGGVFILIIPIHVYVYIIPFILNIIPYKIPWVILLCDRLAEIHKQVWNHVNNYRIQENQPHVIAKCECAFIRSSLLLITSLYHCEHILPIMIPGAPSIDEINPHFMDVLGLYIYTSICICNIIYVLYYVILKYSKCTASVQNQD